MKTDVLLRFITELYYEQQQCEETMEIEISELQSEEAVEPSVPEGLRELWMVYA